MAVGTRGFRFLCVFDFVCLGFLVSLRTLSYIEILELQFVPKLQFSPGSNKVIAFQFVRSFSCIFFLLFSFEHLKIYSKYYSFVGYVVYKYFLPVYSLYCNRDFHIGIILNFFSLSDSFSTWIITEYWVEFPVLYSRSPLTTQSIYHSVHMLIPKPSPSLPSHLSSLVTINLFSKSENVLNFDKAQFIKSILMDHTFYIKFKNLILSLRSQRFSPFFLIKVLYFTCKYMICFE